MIKIKCASGDLEWDSKKIARLSKSEVLILTYLLKNLNEFSSKGELLSQGWPDSYVTPNSLSVAIKNIRKALSLTSSTFSIETIHRKGYILRGEHYQYTIIEHINTTPINTTPTSIDAPQEVAVVHANRDNNLPKERIVEKNDQSVHHWKIFIGTSSVKRIFIGIYLCTIIPLSICILQHSETLYCYQLSPSTEVCGVFYLNDAKQKELQSLLSNQTGRFLYGYEVYSRNFKVYKDDEYDKKNKDN
ncbi:winged helix-turn-helix domain-containing protein [Shewanella xiamenensis]|uniref:winged helix-turn-helix domain-containing protein n=1 Tax=Shewanella xiamenensis TaxID=332186 RepID=UPI001185F44E|nr:helix-turn-helix domain-containing protein [Shewanella xiamenensis]